MGTREHAPDVESHPITWPLTHCPVCGSGRLDPVVETETESVHFLCLDCSRCWHVELGYVHRMTPETCNGCPERGRCEAVLEADRARNRV